MRVLAVDDERMSLRLLVHHLEADGHEVIQAGNGRDALSMALEHSPEIVVSDWRMPEMDGIALVQALRRYEAGRTMYVIMLTGSGDEDEIVQAFDAGIDDYVTKPFNPRVLLARVRAGERVVRLQAQVAEDRRMLKDQMSRLAVLNRKLEKASITDPLTQLKNRRYAIERLREAWAAAERAGKPMSVIMVDIDHFKQVNDKFGHAAGDEVLKATATVFSEHVREDESICRMGGEEFVVICPTAGAVDARKAAERLRVAVERNRISAEGFNGSVTVSLGVATMDASHATFEDLLKAADVAVYESKKNGRNRVSVAVPAPAAPRA